MSQTVTTTLTKQQKINNLYTSLLNGNIQDIINANVDDIKMIMDGQLNNALQIAYNSGYKNIVNYLIDSEKFTNCNFAVHKNKREESLFHLAVYRNDFDLIFKLEQRQHELDSKLIENLNKDIQTLKNVKNDYSKVCKINDKLQEINDKQQENINILKEENENFKKIKNSNIKLNEDIEILHKTHDKLLNSFENLKNENIEIKESLKRKRDDCEGLEKNIKTLKTAVTNLTNSHRK